MTRHDGDLNLRNVVALGVLCLLVSAPVQVVAQQGETWAPKVDPGTAPAKPKPVKPVPAQKEGKAAPSGKGDPSSKFSKDKPADTAKSLAPASGDDAAYVAFDQGQYLTALKLAEEAAKKGDAAAHTLVGRIYGEGLGVGKDDKVAANWYARGAELGDPNAMFAYGVLLAEGRGVAKDRPAAGIMFEKAAATGHALANYNLGMLFLKGDGKPENPYRAAQHIAYAASKGIAQAQYDLGALYQSGVGVKPDAYEASKWLSMAADQGHAAAQYDYAIALLRGLGLNRDLPRAIDYMKSAADKGIPGAQNRLAHIYLEGVGGVEKSTVEAAKWRLVAKAGGIEDKPLDDMVAKLSRAERASAEQAAAEWRERSQVGAVQ
jgi:TPR repeat protein